jgi:hypothetical protein
MGDKNRFCQFEHILHLPFVAKNYSDNEAALAFSNNRFRFTSDALSEEWCRRFSSMRLQIFVTKSVDQVRIIFRGIRQALCVPLTVSLLYQYAVGNFFADGPESMLSIRKIFGCLLNSLFCERNDLHTRSIQVCEHALTEHLHRVKCLCYRKHPLRSQGPKGLWMAVCLGYQQCRQYCHLSSIEQIFCSCKPITPWA